MLRQDPTPPPRAKDKEKTSSEDGDNGNGNEKDTIVPQKAEVVYIHPDSILQTDPDVAKFAFAIASKFAGESNTTLRNKLFNALLDECAVAHNSDMDVNNLAENIHNSAMKIIDSTKFVDVLVIVREVISDFTNNRPFYGGSKNKGSQKKPFDFSKSVNEVLINRRDPRDFVHVLALKLVDQDLPTERRVRDALLSEGRLSVDSEGNFEQLSEAILRRISSIVPDIEKQTIRDSVAYVAVQFIELNGYNS